MIEKLTLTNFRKHEDLVLDFVAGLNVVRGQNEAGKSTLQEAVGYALFGTKALRTNFADTVTWGRAENSLRVELTLNLAGRRLTFSRGKSGAEVIEDGRVIVTGQNEVSLYAANLLGCDGTAAANLMIASQNAMRGSLEQGPKATAAMIEQLADFDLFDVLLERIQTQLLVGAPAAFDTRLAEAKARLESFQPAPKPDDVAHNTWLVDNSRETGRLTKLLTDTLRPAHRIAEKAHEGVLQQTKQHDDAKDDLARAEKALLTHREQRALYSTQAAQLSVDPVHLQAARADLAALEKAAGAAQAYRVFNSLPTCDDEFEGGAEEFATWLEGRRSSLQIHRDARSDTATRLKVAEASLVTSSVCGFCGQDVSAFPEAAEKNRLATVEIAKATDAALGFATIISAIEYEIKAGQAIEVAARKVQAALPQMAGYVQVDHTYVPPRIEWDGAPPTAVDLKPARDRVAKMQLDIIQGDQDRAKAEALISVIEEDGANVKRLAERLAASPLPADSDDLYQAYLDAQGAVRDAEHAVQDLDRESERRREEFNKASAIYEARQGEQQRLSAAVEQAAKDLEDLAFNNALLKKVRTARPIIADKLWNTVLAAVSTMFSQMRGEASVVSKDNGGFKVNGQPIESLSGSTLDILGLAIRTALVKTFIPHAPFMLLDEAAAACDEDRTGSLLGFVAGSGFEQVVLVTHESASEAVADNVIQL